MERERLAAKVHGEPTDELSSGQENSEGLSSTTSSTAGRQRAAGPEGASDKQQVSHQHQHYQPTREAQQAKSRLTSTNRSQSSPSSLTTHKFGLRPTPSPPRLIIDHQTGDIVESYPSEPTYLRTYQPIEANLDGEPDDNSAATTIVEDSLNYVQPSSRVPDGSQQLEQVGQLLLEGRQLKQQASQLGRLLPDDSDDDLSSAMSSGAREPSRHHQALTQHQLKLQLQQQQQQQQQQQVIPPPHSGRVYFGPTPDPNLFESSGPQPGAEHRASGGHNASFKRAINKLAEAGRTDIAILPEPDEGPRRAPAEFKVTATSASRANALLAQQHQSAVRPKCPNRRQADKRGLVEELPPIEESTLYDFSYNFRLLLVLLLSSLIIYLLVGPLHLDCARFRPTYTYVSIICAAVNLICIVIFTLFWYCNGVTRTLYADLSSSAFIITIYSILVGLNLALAVLFFFINTCHFQKQLSTYSTLPIAAGAGAASSSAAAMVASPINNAEPFDIGPTLEMLDARGQSSGKLESTGSQLDAESSSQQKPESRGGARLGRREIANDGARSLSQRPVSSHSSSQATGVSRTAGPWVVSKRSQSTEEAEGENQVDPTVIDDQLGPEQQPTQAPTPPRHKGQDHFGAHQEANQEAGPMPTMSPLEAAWEFSKELFKRLRRDFNRFLVRYDLKFVGALHALCAICLQYLAIKVAVVRSFYSAPVGQAGDLAYC